MTMNKKVFLTLLLAALVISLGLPHRIEACTGITLKAADGSVVFGRTLEWGSFDLKSRLAIVPRGKEFVGTTPDGKPGLKWQGKYGVVAIDAVEKDVFGDGMNEKGLALGFFYHPGVAEYQEYLSQEASKSLAPTDIPQFILTQFATVDEVRGAMEKVRVVPTVEHVLGIPAPAHFIVTDPSGKSIVIEFLQGKLVIFDNPLGVVTNSPSFDWHLTNLRNYINLSPVALPGKKIEELNFTPLGGGSGMIGLPGDFTPPSRFVRAVAFSKTARSTPDGPETIYEVFRILDNFNVPLGAAEGGAGSAESLKGLRSATPWTAVSDTKNRVYYYHTQHNRRVRQVDLKAIDFNALKGDIVRLPLDKEKAQDIEDRTPRK